MTTTAPSPTSTETAGALLAGVNHVAVVVRDLDRWVEFWTTVFGTTFEEVPDERGRHGFLALDAAITSILHAFETPTEMSGGPIPNGGMFRRGRLDHLGIGAADEAALKVLRDRLVARGAVRRLDPVVRRPRLQPVRRRPGRDGVRGELLPEWGRHWRQRVRDRPLTVPMPPSSSGPAGEARVCPFSCLPGGGAPPGAPLDQDSYSPETSGGGRNRTHRTGITRPTRFEDEGAHQAPVHLQVL